MTVMDTPQKEWITPEWQQSDLDYLEQLDVSANWSQMGCFKTSTGLWLAEKKLKTKEAPKLLIITTRSGKGTYLEALPALLPKWWVFNAHTKGLHYVWNGMVLSERECAVDELRALNAERPTVVLAHYNCFVLGTPILELLKKFHWDMVIVDEAHRIKNRKAKWTRGIKSIRSTYRHIMTGTGFINSPDEIWSLLNFLDRKRWSSYHHFRELFCEIEDWTGFPKVVGVKPELIEEFRAIRKHYGPRREMTEVFPNIPRPIFTPVEVDLNPTQRKMYRELITELQTLDRQGYPIHSPNVLSLLNRLRQIAVATPIVVGDYYDPKLERRVIKVRLEEPSSKLDACMEIIEGLEWDDERRDQVVVYSQFRDPLELLKTRLDNKKVPYIHLQTTDNDTERDYKWRTLFPRKEHQVFLTTLQLGSESINLTSARTAIFLDRSWSPKDNEQAVGRVFRPGQQFPANIIHINARHTVDARILAANKEKLGWFAEIFGADDED